MKKVFDIESILVFTPLHIYEILLKLISFSPQKRSSHIRNDMTFLNWLNDNTDSRCKSNSEKFYSLFFYKNMFCNLGNKRLYRNATFINSCGGFCECSAIKRKQSYLKKYGVENPLQSAIIRDKIKKTNIEKYGVDNPMKLESTKAKARTTNIKKYGSISYLVTDDALDKKKLKNIEKYGSAHYKQSELGKLKYEKTMKQKYGVTNPGNMNDHVAKLKKTNMKKYNIEFPMQDVYFRKKYTNAMIRKYGVNYSHLIGKSRQDIDNFYDDGTFAELYDKSNNIKQLSKTISFSTSAIQKRAKLLGLPLKNGISWPHQLIIEHLYKLGIAIEINNRKIIEPYELDIVIPSKGLAIEINGSYWHGIGRQTDTNYHLNKTLLCRNKRYHLIHLNEKSIYNDFDIVTEIIGIHLMYKTDFFIPDKFILDRSLFDERLFGNHVIKKTLPPQITDNMYDCGYYIMELKGNRYEKSI